MRKRLSMSGAQAIDYWALHAPEAMAVVEGARRHSFAQANIHLCKIVKALDAAGVGSDMIVGVSFAGRYMHLLLLLACEVLGATHVSLTLAELNGEALIAKRCALFLIERSDLDLSPIGKVVKIDAAFVEQALAAPLSARDLERLQTPQSPDLGVRVASSSGTTGEPKRMLKTRRMIDGAIESYEHMLKPVDGPFRYYCLYGPALGGVYIDLVRALNFANEIVFASMAEFMGNPNKFLSYALLLPKEANTILDLCKTHRINLNLYYVDITGAGVDETFHAELEAHVSPNVLNVYSSNEMSSIARLERGDHYVLAPGVDIEIVDDEGREVAFGEQGLIRARTAYSVAGYLWDDELTARTFDHGWFHMNDFGLQPEPGKLVVLGRADDMLNIGGEKISPYPIESALNAIDGVSGVAVLQLDNAFGVGTLCVVIEPEPGRDERALMILITQVMTPLNRTFGVRFEPLLPRTDTGKIQRKVLQARSAPTV